MELYYELTGIHREVVLQEIGVSVNTAAPVLALNCVP